MLPNAGYSFGYGSTRVKCAELDRFRHELRALCERYGIGFELFDNYDDCRSLRIVSIKEADFDIFIDGLDNYTGGIPWLDEAKAEHQRLYLAESARIFEAGERKREIEERAQYARLKAKYE